MDEQSTSSNSSLKFKIAYGSDIRRVGQAIKCMDDLRNTAQKLFKPNCEESTLKYFYYDSDEDRIEISDDEDFESALVNCSKSGIKFHVEMYDVQKDSFFNSLYLSEKADLNTGASSSSSKDNYDRQLNLVLSGKSLESSFNQQLTVSVDDQEQNEDYPEFLSAVKYTDSGSEYDSDNEEPYDSTMGISKFPKVDSTKSQNEEEIKMPNQKVSEVHQRRNTEDDLHGYDVLEHFQTRISSKSIPKGNKISNSNDPRFDNYWAKCLSSNIQQKLTEFELIQLKKEWQFQVKAEKCFDKEYDRKRYMGLNKAL